MLFSLFATALLAAAAPLEPRQADPGVPIIAGNVTQTKCLAVRGGAGVTLANGVAVELRDCRANAPEQTWNIVPGRTQVRVANSTFCLDAGIGPKDGRRMKIWTCYAGVKQQDWWLTGDGRIALTDQGLCLDNTNGAYKNGNRVQVWTCGTGNMNQVWSPKFA